MDRDEFMDIVYSELESDSDNNRANRIIDAADEYVENTQFGTKLAEVGTDCISRRQAIDAVTDELDMIDHVPKWVFDRLEKRLKQLPNIQPEPCEDAVSRAEVLRMIDCINDHHTITPYKSVGAVTEHLTRIASNLSPVAPKQRTGHWIPVDSYTAYGGDEVTWMAHGNPVAFHYCSACKEHAYAGEDGDDILSNFCPHCGVKMVGVSE